MDESLIIVELPQSINRVILFAHFGVKFRYYANEDEFDEIIELGKFFSRYDKVANLMGMKCFLSSLFSQFLIYYLELLVSNYFNNSLIMKICVIDFLKGSNG